MTNINCLFSLLFCFYYENSITTKNILNITPSLANDKQNLEETLNNIVESVLFKLNEKKEEFKNCVKTYKEIIHNINFLNPCLCPNFDNIELDLSLYIGFNEPFCLLSDSDENRIFFDLNDKETYEKAKRGELTNELIKIGIKFYDDLIISMNNIIITKIDKL